MSSVPQQQFQSYGGMPYGSGGFPGGQQGGPAGGRYYNTVQVLFVLCCKAPCHNPGGGVTTGGACGGCI